MTNLPIDVPDESWVQAAADAVRAQRGQIDAVAYVSGIGAPTLDYFVESNHR